MSRTEQAVRPLRFYFHAMNTKVEVQLLADREQAEHAASLVKNWFETQEQRFSRFVADSELTRLNESHGWISVSAAMDEVLSLAYGYIGQTEGIFQPSIMKALRSSGYDVSFEKIQQRPSQRPLVERLISTIKSEAAGMSEEPFDYSRPSWIQREGSRMVHLDPGTELDLGGIVKGWAVERIADWLQKRMNIPAGMINAGGDIQVWGTTDHPHWTLDVTNPSPQTQNVLGAVRLQRGAVATSGVTRRQWQDNKGNRAHHLIDPRTMKPADTDILQCTVVGQHASQCEIIAKTVSILGSAEAVNWLNRHYDRHDVLWITGQGNVYFRGNSSTLAERWPGFDPDHRFSLIE
ncbi:thiamine biosynthesis lipoprotein [Paenibacillus sp. 4624]|uniref:FAD:protein FMN transferase n=1 Tax=Paenibacillus amylolyticus TaxID=1451 RepID=A0A5M9WT94_PAEAM|nr:FAD:protein FMN transferase [Paenibacillus amylolyticus]KAA8784762.1 FAD:protein FMN transferase [Paenibacillus amylolyticus]